MEFSSEKFAMLKKSDKRNNGNNIKYKKRKSPRKPWKLLKTKLCDRNIIKGKTLWWNTLDHVFFSIEKRRNQANGSKDNETDGYALGFTAKRGRRHTLWGKKRKICRLRRCINTKIWEILQKSKKKDKLHQPVTAMILKNTKKKPTESRKQKPKEKTTYEYLKHQTYINHARKPVHR